MRFLIVLLLSVSPLAALAEARAADVDKAARLVFDEKYDAAARLLDTAWKQSGNKREIVLRILELQGVVFAQQGAEAKAKQTFQMLLTLDPKRELNGKYSNKVLKPFNAAQAWAIDNPPLEAGPEPAAVDPGTGKVLQIAVKVKTDNLKLVKKARIFIRPEGAKWIEAEVEVQGSYASAGTDSDGVEWYAELLGDRDMVLHFVGTRSAPIREGKLRKEEPAPEKKPDPVVKKDEPKKDTPTREPEIEPEREPEPEAKPATSRSGANSLIRYGGYAALGVGMVSLVVGTIFGALWRLTSDDLSGKVRMATLDGSGAILSLPGVSGPAHVYYQATLGQLRLDATVANTLWGVGAALAVTGVVLYLLGRDSAD